MAHGLQIMKMCEAFSKSKIKNQKLKVELVVPWRFRISKLGKKNPFEYYKVDRTFKIKKIFSFDLTPLNRYLGPISSLIQALSFSFFVSIYLLFKLARRRGRKSDIIYSRDRFSLFFISFFRGNAVFEIHKIHRSLDRSICKRVKKIIAITGGLKKELDKRGIKREKILIAPDAIDLADFEFVEADIRRSSSLSRNTQINADEIKKERRRRLNLPIDKRLIIYTGNLFKWKGVETIALSSKFLDNDTVIVIVGGTKWYLSNFKKFVKKNNLKNILILGYQNYSKIPYFLKAADCLVLTGTKKSDVSQYQTSPMKMFEYMTSQRPIVASDLPSFREILSENNSILIEPDNPKALAKGIKRILDNPDSAKRISDQAYKNVQKYTWDKRAKKILRFITS